MKNIIFFIIGLYFISCNIESNKSVGELWREGQQYRTDKKLKEAITTFKFILEKYPSTNKAAEAQFQIADIYLNDIKDFNFAIEEFQKVVNQYPNHDVSKKSLFMIAYIYNNYLNAFSDAIITYNLFTEKYPNDELIPSVKYELEGLKDIQSTIDSLNLINKKSNI